MMDHHWWLFRVGKKGVAPELECLALDWLSKIRPFRLSGAGKMMIWLFRAWQEGSRLLILEPPQR